MSDIEGLSPELEEALEEFRQEWFEIGTCCEPADRPLFEAAISELYRDLGVKKPEVIWGASPMETYRVVESLRNSEHIAPDNLVNRLIWNSLWEPLWLLLNVCCGARVRVHFEDWPLPPVDYRKIWLISSLYRAHFEEWDEDSPWGSLESLLRWAPEAIQYDGPVYGGQMSSPDISFFLFLEQYLGIDFGEQLSRGIHLLGAIARSAFWWRPYGSLVIVSDRPCFIGWDDRGRVHADGRPAVEFRDGWGLYAWHGAQIPEEWGSVPFREWKPEWLLENRIQSDRRILMEALGYERVMATLKSKLIHCDGQMELRQIDGVDVEPMRLLRVICPSTGRPYLLRVPPHIDECEPARRWTFGDEPLEMILET